MVKVTKLPPGPEPKEPIVGQLYTIMFIPSFCYFAKLSHEKWGSETDAVQIKKLISSVPYVLLTKYKQNEEEGCISGQIMVSDKLIDFWIPIDDITQKTCSDIWYWHFIPTTKL